LFKENKDVSWNKIFVCSEEHEYRASELSAHSSHWSLESINRMRCPDCHSATTWKEKHPKFLVDGER